MSETVLDEEREMRFVASNLGWAPGHANTAAVQLSQIGSRKIFMQTDIGIEQIVANTGPTASPEQQPQNRLIIPSDYDTHWSVSSTLGVVESRTFARQDRVRIRRFPVQLDKVVGATDELVETPAGTFANCVRIDGNGQRSVRTDRGNSVAEVYVQTREWYAPNVGLIKLEREETSDSTFLKPGRQDWLLLSYGE